MNLRRRREVVQQFTDPKLIMRMRLFLLIFLVMIGVVGYDIVRGTIGLRLAAAGLGGGLVVGVLVGRMLDVFWHEDKGKVVSRMDAIGVGVLVVYLALSLSRNWIVGHWVHGPALTAIGFSSIAGVMLGRVISMGGRIRRVLLNRGII